MSWALMTSWVIVVPIHHPCKLVEAIVENSSAVLVATMLGMPL
jgi:hypothetical protein